MMVAGISPGVMRRIKGNARLASLFVFLRKRHADRHAVVKIARHVRAVGEFKPPHHTTSDFDLGATTALSWGMSTSGRH